MSRDYTSTELGATLLYVIALIALVIRVYTDCFYEIFDQFDTYDKNICNKKSPTVSNSYVIDIEKISERDYHLTTLN